MSGMRETPPADLDQALIDLEADAPTPSAFERVARWRRACGDAESAAEWQTWSLLPPEQADLRTALAECWRRLGRFDQAARLLNEQAPSWHQLILVLQQQNQLMPTRSLCVQQAGRLIEPSQSQPALGQGGAEVSLLGRQQAPGLPFGC